MAFSMALSDHYFSLEQLNEIGNKIKNGENVKLNDADKQRFISEMKDARKNNDLVNLSAIDINNCLAWLSRHGVIPRYSKCRITRM